MVIVGEASDGAEALKALQTLSENSAEPSGLPSVDVLVMDVSMPNGNGIETTEKIKRQWPKLRVLALSMHEDRSYVRGMLQARVAGYVFKRSAADTLMGAIRLVASGQTYVDPALTPEGNSEPPNRTPLRGELYGARLSERESDALRLIAQGYTNKEIAAKMEISVKTVETYKSRATEKLGLDSRAAIVRYALQRGWLTPAG
jgi:DNA-binding NarL/FixJ family response regulator